MIFSFHVNFRGPISRFRRFLHLNGGKAEKKRGARCSSRRNARKVAAEGTCRPSESSMSSRSPGVRYGPVFTVEKWESNCRGANKHRQNDIFLGQLFNSNTFSSTKQIRDEIQDSGLFGWNFQILNIDGTLPPTHWSIFWHWVLRTTLSVISFKARWRKLSIKVRKGQRNRLIGLRFNNIRKTSLKNIKGIFPKKKLLGIFTRFTTYCADSFIEK